MIKIKKKVTVTGNEEIIDTENLTQPETNKNKEGINRDDITYGVDCDQCRILSQEWIKSNNEYHRNEFRKMLKEELDTRETDIERGIRNEKHIKVIDLVLIILVIGQVYSFYQIVHLFNMMDQLMKIYGKA